MTADVIDATVEAFDRRPLISVHDLGPPGRNRTPDPVATADMRLYRRTSHEIIGIDNNEIVSGAKKRESPSGFLKTLFAY